MQKLFSGFWSEENGQDMVEYSLMLGFVALTGVGVLSGARNESMSVWQAISNSFVNAAS